MNTAALTKPCLAALLVSVSLIPQPSAFGEKPPASPSKKVDGDSDTKKTKPVKDKDAVQEDEKVDRTGKRPWLGLVVEPLPLPLAQHLQSKDGIYVVMVQVGSPADKVGIKQGDVIVAIGDEKVHHVGDLTDAVAAIDGDSLELTLLESSGERTVTVAPDWIKHPIMPHHAQAGIPPEIQRLMQQMQGQNPANINTMLPMIQGYSHWMPAGEKIDFDRNVRIEVKRDAQGNETVMAEIDGKKYQTDSGHLNALPPELARVVSMMVVPRPTLPQVAPESHSDPQVQQMQEDLNALRKQLEQLRRELAPVETDTPGTNVR